MAGQKDAKLPRGDGIPPGGPFIVELFFDEPPKLDRTALAIELAPRLGRLDGSADECMFALLDHVVELQDGRVPVTLAFVAAEHANRNEAARERYASALQQAWDWDEAGDVLARCQHSILVTDLFAGGLPAPDRVEIIDAAVRAAIATMPVRAIAFVSSDRIADPAKYVQGRKLHDHLQHLFLNIRFFRVSDGSVGEAVMDSLGLAIFGLPDVQCHFVGGVPRKMASFLFGCASYLFERGDVIADGETIQGPGGERWLCQHEHSMLSPKRVVVDIRPGVLTPPSRA
jgi:hypothetical protein